MHCLNKKLTTPSRYYFQRWVNAALQGQCKTATVAIRLTNEKESAFLNETYRGKKGPTNILSFPFEPPANIQTSLLGDLIICVPVIEKEAKQQGKLLLAHWAHMVIHGCLHLIGYDHIKTNDAKIMETLEVKILKKLQFEDPYL